MLALRLTLGGIALIVAGNLLSMAARHLWVFTKFERTPRPLASLLVYLVQASFVAR